MAGIEDRHVDRAKKLVLEKFPEMAGVEPSLSKKRSQCKGVGRKPTSSTSADRPRHYVLTFEKDVSLPEGRSLKRLVRVTMNESGEVLKLVSSK